MGEEKRRGVGFAIALATGVVVAALAVVGILASVLSPKVVGVGPLPPVPAAPSPAPVVTKSTVTPGLTLTTIADPEGPERIWVLELDPSSGLTLDAALVRRDLGGKGPLTRMASREGAIAAVNGDYGIPIGRPLHLFAADGRLLQTSLINNNGRNVAWNQDASRVFFGRPHVSIVATPPRGRNPISITGWNDGPPGPDAVAGFTGAGADVVLPPAHMCAVRMVPTEAPMWTAKQEAISQLFDVVASACRATPMPVGSEGVVLVAQAKGSRARALQVFSKGEEVALSWSLDKWPGVLDAVGGSALLVEDGAVVTEKCHGNYECWRHPHTGIGVTAEGHILLVAVDGRREGWSIGMRREGFAALMLTLGATDAMALDGGASTEMVVQGQVLNQPSGNKERRLMSAIFVLPGPDPDVPKSLATD